MTNTPIYMPESAEAEKQHMLTDLKEELKTFNEKLEDMHIAITGTIAPKKEMLETIIRKRPDLANEAISAYGMICFVMAQILERGGRLND